MPKHSQKVEGPNDDNDFLFCPEFTRPCYIRKLLSSMEYNVSAFSPFIDLPLCKKNESPIIHESTWQIARFKISQRNLE